MQGSYEPMKNKKDDTPHYRQLRGESDFPHKDALIEFKVFNNKNDQIVYGRNYFSEEFGWRLIEDFGKQCKILYRIID